MKALKVFEAYNFQRGQGPKRVLSLGKYNSPLYRALTDPDNQVDGEAFQDWMETNPTLKEAIEYNTGEPIDQYLTFDLDWYCEDKGIDRDELMEDFEVRKLLGRKKSGELIVKAGIIKNIPQPNKVLFYQGGNIDGFITKKSWIGINEDK